MKITISNSGGIGVNSDSVTVFTNTPAPTPVSKLEHLTDVATLTGNQNKFLQNNATGTGAVWTTLDLAPKVNRAGDTMTGSLTLSGASSQVVLPNAPTIGTHAVNKTYADSKLSLIGGTMTGLLILSADPSVALGAATKQYVDSSIVASKAESVSLAGDTMTGMLTLPATAPTALQATTKTYVDSAISTAAALEVSKAGDTMTGALILSADPTVALQAATKQYVDTAKTAADTNANTKVPLSGGTMTGLLTLSGAPTVANHAATKAYVDSLKTAADTNANTKVPLSGGTMTGLLILSADPSAALGAATKQYVDTAISSANSESVSLTGDTMTGMLTLPATAPTALQATTKSYVDSAISTAVATAQAQEVSKAGDTMTGLLVLSADPSVALGAATKQYVDAQKTAADTNANTKLALTGGTMTGMITLPSTAPTALQATTKTYVDAGDATRLPLAGGTMTGALTLSGAPTVALHAATKAYVDSVVTAGGLPTTGGTMTGMITLPSTTPTALQATTKTYVDSAIAASVPTGVLFLTGGTMTGSLILNADPSVALGAATKQYVDTQSALKLSLTGGSLTGALTIANNTAGAYALNVTNNVDGQTRITLGHPSTVAKQSAMVHYTAAVNGALAESLHLGVAAHSCLTMNTTEIKAHKKLVTIAGVSGVDATNPYFELHKPGVRAAMWHLPTNNEIVLSETGGNGVASVNHLKANLVDGTTYFNASRWTNTKSHAYAAQYGQWAPLSVDFGTGTGASDWYPALKARHVITGQGYTTDAEFGILRSGNAFGTACIRVGSGEAATQATQSVHSFGADGNSYSPGLVQAGTGFRTTGSLTINNVSPTILFQDTDHKSGFIHVNSNYFYILRSAANNGTAWDTGPNGRHPMTLSLDNGNVVFSGAVIANSDLRLKENIKPLSSSLFKILQLQGMNYTMIPEAGKTENTGVKCGFIAQEVREIIPEVVYEQVDGMLGIDYSAMVSYLTEATKEQQDQINELKDTVRKQAEYIDKLKDLSDRMDELMAVVRYRTAN